MLIGLPDKAKGRKLSKFVFVKGRHFTIFFANWINSKLISELVSSDNTVFLCINATQV